VSASSDGERIDELRAALRVHRPVDEREAASLQLFRAELDRLEAPFDEHAGPAHVTASALIVSERGVVLLRHKRLGIWLQPGGHVDPDEPVWEAARREAWEETGLAVSHPDDGPVLVHVDVHEGAKPACRVHLDARYLLHAPPDDPMPPEDESQFVQWFSYEEAARVADHGLSAAVTTLRALT
jgi:8-oxo-dGTP pyrophosphatase MutT (NUDIX family)